MTCPGVIIVFCKDIYLHCEFFFPFVKVPFPQIFKNYVLFLFFAGLHASPQCSVWCGELHTVVNGMFSCFRMLPRYHVFLNLLLLPGCIGTLWPLWWSSSSGELGEVLQWLLFVRSRGSACLGCLSVALKRGSFWLEEFCYHFYGWSLFSSFIYKFLFLLRGLYHCRLALNIVILQGELLDPSKKQVLCLCVFQHDWKLCNFSI